MSSAQRSASLCTTALRVSARVGIPTQVCLAPDLAFSPHHPMFCLWTAQQVLWKFLLFFLSLSWGSFPTPAASQKANYACQWPVSSNRISDGYGAISASASLCPELSSQEALAVWQQVVSAACFATLSAQTASLNLSAIHHLPALNSPFASSPPISEACKSQLWKLSEHQGRLETLLPGLGIGLWGKFHWDSPNEDYLWTT